MRWEKKAPRFVEGDYRKRNKFAWFPIQIDNYTVWLETYGVEEQLRATLSYNEFGQPATVLDWVETKRNVINYERYK